MKKVGLREANLHFSKFIKQVRGGEEIILTERGIPIATIKPILKKDNIISKLKALEQRGILKTAKRGKISDNIPIAIKGKPVSDIVIEGREDRT